MRVVPVIQRKSKLSRKTEMKIGTQMLSASVYFCERKVFYHTVFCERKVFYHTVHFVLLQKELVQGRG